jgi:hypothetical protein
MKPLIFLEMNEINFDYIKRYIDKGHLKNFCHVLVEHGICETTSETKYEILEPWIQWVSARTGRSYAQHHVFRLGDIVDSNVDQHWEILERKGLTVAAISPINAANRVQRSPFWIPDPWVSTSTSGGRFERELANAVRQAVNDNATESLSFRTILTLVRTMLTKTKLKSWPSYGVSMLGILKRQHWSKAILLDRLLADVFFRLWSAHRPDFSTLFLNSAAHIQHHYLISSGAYEGSQENPAWYIRKNADPVLEIYKVYDSILGEAIKLDARIMVATGLKQVPHEKVVFYYRLRDHARFLSQLSIPFESVHPRMSRDFLIECANREDALTAENVLKGLQSAQFEQVFDVDNRGESLFVTLVYPQEIGPGFAVLDQNRGVAIGDFYPHVAFVAIKNGQHHASGYFVDTALRDGEAPKTMRLENLFDRVVEHFESISGARAQKDERRDERQYVQTPMNE